MKQINSHQQLEKRLKMFILEILAFVRKLPKTEENVIYSRQILRSSSSVGVNYAEAVYAHTRQDFLHGINICRKETSETFYWLQLIFEANPLFQPKMNNLLDENKQILKIFISSVKTTK